MLNLTLNITDQAVIRRILMAMTSEEVEATTAFPPQPANLGVTADSKRTRATKNNVTEMPAPVVEPKAEAPKAETAPEVVKTPEVVEPAASQGKTYTLETLMPIAIQVMAKNREGLAKLLGEFGTTKIKALDASKYNEFGPKLEALNA